MKIVVLGDGYVGSAFKDSGFDCIAKEEQFKFNGKNIADLFGTLMNYNTIINAIGYTNTTTSELPENFQKVWNANVLFVEHLSNYCYNTGKKLVHISTGDLYGNNFNLKETVETTTKIDVGTTYRLSKYVGEKFCNPNDLIIRIRLPFDGRNHPKNILTKIPKFKNLYSFLNDYTYIPDLIDATKVLIDRDAKGIYNLACHEDGSVIYLLRNVLELPQFKDYDLHDQDHPNIIRDLSNVHVHNIMNDDKIREYYIQTTLEDAIKKSWQELQNNLQSA